MLCRVLLAIVAFSCMCYCANEQGTPRALKDLVCVLFLSGLQKEDLDVTLLSKLEHYNIDLNDRSLTDKCNNTTIPRSVPRLQTVLQEKENVTHFVATKKVAETARATTNKDLIELDNLQTHSLSKDDDFTHSETTKDIADETNKYKSTTANKINNVLNTPPVTETVVNENNSTENPINTLKSPEDLQPNLKSLQNIVHFWVKHIETMTTSALPVKTITHTEVTSTTPTSGTERPDANSNGKSHISKVEQISKLVAEYLYAHKKINTVQNQIERETITTTRTPLVSSTTDHRETEDKFALSLNAINKLNENLESLQHKLKSSEVSNNSKVKEEADGIVIFPRSPSKNLQNTVPNYKDFQVINDLFQNKHDKLTITVSDNEDRNIRLEEVVFAKPQIVNPYNNNKYKQNIYKQASQAHMHKVANIKKQFYRDPNQHTLCLGTYAYDKLEDEINPMENLNNNNETSKTDLTKIENCGYTNKLNAYSIMQPNSNNRDLSHNNHYIQDNPFNNHKSNNENMDVNLSNEVQRIHFENFVNSYKKETEYQVPKIKNVLPKDAVFKILQYSPKNNVVNKHVALDQNQEQRMRQHYLYKSSDGETASDKWKFGDQAANDALDSGQPILGDTFKNKVLQMPRPDFDLTRHNFDQLEGLRNGIRRFNYDDTLLKERTPVEENNNSDLKSNQQFSANENKGQHLKNSVEKDANNALANEQQNDIDTLKNHHRQPAQLKYKYNTPEKFDFTVQNDPKLNFKSTKTLLTYNSTLPSNMLQQIAESVKEMILKYLKKEINNSLHIVTTWPFSSQTLLKPSLVSLEATSVTAVTLQIPAITASSIAKTMLSTATISHPNNLSTNYTSTAASFRTTDNTNLTDITMKQKMDRVKEATEVIEKFLKLFGKYTAAVQEKRIPMNATNIHQEYSVESEQNLTKTAPTAILLLPRPEVTPYDIGVQQNPVVVKNYVVPQKKTLHGPLIPSLPLMQPIPVMQKSQLKPYSAQQITILTNLNEIQPIRVPIAESTNQSIPSQNNEENNRWNTQPIFGNYAQIKSYFSPVNTNSDGENVINEKVETKGTNHATATDEKKSKLLKFYNYMVRKFKEEEEKEVQVKHQKENIIREFGENKNQLPEFNQNFENIYNNRTNVKTQNPDNDSNGTNLEKILAQFGSSENVYKIFYPSKKENDYYDTDKSFAMNNRRKASAFFHKQWHDNIISAPKLMPTKEIDTQIKNLRTMDAQINEFKDFPKYSDQSAHKYFDSKNLDKDVPDSLSYYRRDAQEDKFSKKYAQYRLNSESNVNEPTYKTILLDERINSPIDKYYNKDENINRNRVNNRKQLRQFPYGERINLDNYQFEENRSPWFANKRKGNEKWHQKKAQYNSNPYNKRNSNEVNYYKRYRKRLRHREENSDEKSRSTQKQSYDTYDTDTRYNDMNEKGFREKLKVSRGWNIRSEHSMEYPERIPSRQQMPLTDKPKNNADLHFENFLKTQQKVNQMLEKILATKRSNP